MKQVTTFIAALFISGACLAQPADSLNVTKDYAQWLESEFNITYMPESFYDCVNTYKVDNSIMNHTVFDICFSDKIMFEAKYSDGGLEATDLFASYWVEHCMKSETDRTEKETLKKCMCYFEEYLKKPMGMETILSEDFQESNQNKGVKMYCRESQGIEK